MKEVRIYQAGSLEVGQILELSPEAGLHVGVVLRMKVGERITLFCGDNREYSAHLIEVHRKKVFAKIVEEHAVNRESPRPIHLAQAISKGERMEFVMQKAVELGVASICPIMTERSVVKLDQARLEKKQAQWQAIVVAACEQSGRNQVPKVKKMLSLDEYLQQNNAHLKLVLDPTGAKTWRDYPFTEAEFSLLIGPEGGFSQKELLQIISAGFKPLCLGPRVLRTNRR